MELTGITINNRYRLIKKISEGNFSDCYEAVNTDGAPGRYTVRIINDSRITAGDEENIRIRHDLGVISSLNHPNIMKIHEFGEVFKLPYIVMEFIPGTRLFSFLHKREVSIKEAVDIILQIVRALDMLHSNGIIHRGLNPSRIHALTDPVSGRTTVKIKDIYYPHIRESRGNEISTDSSSDFFEYFSPEQLSLKNDLVDQRSDLYSLGIIFYRLLTGRYPYTTEQMLISLHGGAIHPPGRPGSIRDDIDLTIESIILKLISIERATRYSCASVLLYDLEKYQMGGRDFPLEVTARGFNPDYRADFTGRNGEYSNLVAQYDKAAQGNGRVCLIKGESGIGKTRLIEEFISHTASPDAVIITARCASDTRKEPYGLARELLDSYIETYNSYPREKRNAISDSLKDSLGTLGNIIIKLNHNMTGIIGSFPEPVRINPEHENERFQSIAGDFFIKLAAVEKPLIIAVDDLQWADDGSLGLLHKLFSKITGSPILFIAAYRVEETFNRDYFLKFLGEIESYESAAAQIELGLLNINDTGNILSSILYNSNQIIRDLAGFVHLKSSGNPLFTIEILKSLIDRGALFYADRRWYYNSAGLKSADIPATATGILIARISLLGKTGTEVLSYASLTGNSFDIELLYDLFSEMEKRELNLILENCISLKLLYRDSNKGNRLFFTHDRIREVLSSAIEPECLKIIHSRIAASYERVYSRRIDDIVFYLAYHCIESGDREKTLQYSLKAAQKASDTFANEEAIHFFKTAISILQPDDDSNETESRKIWIGAQEGLVKVYLRTGRYDDSIAILNRIIPYIDDYAANALSHNMISHAFFKKGDWRLCELYAKKGIEGLDEKLPVIKRDVILSLIKELLIHFFHGSSLTAPFKTDNADDNKKNELRILIYETLGFMYSITSPLKYIRITLKILNSVGHGTRSGDMTVKALYLYGSLLSVMQRFKSAKKYLLKSLALAEKINDPYLTAMSCYYLGTCYEWQGSYKEAIEKHLKAEELFKSIGNSTGIGFILNGLCNCYLHLSEFDSLINAAEENYNLSLSTMNAPLTCNALLYKAAYSIRKGDLDMAMIYARIVNERSTELGVLSTLCVSCYYIGFIYFHKDDFSSAVEYYERALSIYEKNRFIKHYSYAVYPLYTEVLVSIYKDMKETAESEMRTHLAKIKRYNRLSLKNSIKLPSVYKYSLISAAKYYAIAGKNGKAEKFFKKGIAITTAHGMKYDLARTIYEYGMFLSGTGNTSRANREFELSYHIFNEIGASYYTGILKKILGIKHTGNNSIKIRQIVQQKKIELIDRLVLEIGQTTGSESRFNDIINCASTIAGINGGALYSVDSKNGLTLCASSGFPPHEIFKTEFYINGAWAEAKPVTSVSDDIASIYIPVSFQGKTIAVCVLSAPSYIDAANDESINLLSLFMSKISWVIYYLATQPKASPNNDDNRLKVTPANERKIKKVISYIEENYKFDISREGLSTLIDANPDYFGRCFKLYTGLKINEYIHKIRIEEAAKKLAETDRKIIDIALSVGFDNLSTFNKAFHKTMKMIPSQYRSRHSRYSK